MVIEIEVGALAGRALVVDDTRWVSFSQERRAAIATYPIRAILDRSELLTTTETLALSAARELFQRFGRNLSSDLLRDWLRKLKR